jgi:hypothetical protein
VDCHGPLAVDQLNSPREGAAFAIEPGGKNAHPVDGDLVVARGQLDADGDIRQQKVPGVCKHVFVERHWEHLVNLKPLG